MVHRSYTNHFIVKSAIHVLVPHPEIIARIQRSAAGRTGETHEVKYKPLSSHHHLIRRYRQVTSSTPFHREPSIRGRTGNIYILLVTLLIVIAKNKQTGYQRDNPPPKKKKKIYTNHEIRLSSYTRKPTGLVIPLLHFVIREKVLCDDAHHILNV